MKTKMMTLLYIKNNFLSQYLFLNIYLKNPIIQIQGIQDLLIPKPTIYGLNN